jgi:hypothetical protein
MLTGSRQRMQLCGQMRLHTRMVRRPQAEKQAPVKWPRLRQRLLLQM